MALTLITAGLEQISWHLSPCLNASASSWSHLVYCWSSGLLSFVLLEIIGKRTDVNNTEVNIAAGLKPGLIPVNVGSSADLREQLVGGERG